jgi:hypothetical protein
VYIIIICQGKNEEKCFDDVSLQAVTTGKDDIIVTLEKAVKNMYDERTPAYLYWQNCT